MLINFSEDNYHHFDKPWISSLRLNDPLSLERHNLSIQAASMLSPPSFYRQDLQKWESKFQKAIDERKKWKNIMAKTSSGTEFNITTKNTNFSNTCSSNLAP